MTVHLQNFSSHALSEILPFSFNSVCTGALTYAGQYLPEVVEQLSFDIELHPLGLGAVYVSLAGGLINAVAKANGSEKAKSQAAQVFLYALAAFGSAYFLPQAAASAGWVISQENAMAVASASTVSNFICMMLR